MSTSAQNPKQTWLILWGALTLAPLVYYVVGALVSPAATPIAQLGAIRTGFAALAAVQLVVGATLMARAGRARARAVPPEHGAAAVASGHDLATPQAFQTLFIIGAAQVEACAIWGFVLLFLGAPLEQCLLFGAAAVAVMVAIGLPAGLRYWSERQDAGTETPPPIG